MNTCADLDCGRPPTDLLRYTAPDGTRRRYPLCALHLDRAHQWLATRPHLAVTAISERLLAPTHQPALF